jgi:hypothetical protein
MAGTVALLGVGIAVAGFAGAFWCARRRVVYLNLRLRRLEAQTRRNGRRLQRLEVGLSLTDSAMPPEGFE